MLMKVKYRIAELEHHGFKVQTKGMYSWLTWYNNVGGAYFRKIEDAEEWIRQDILFEKHWHSKKIYASQRIKKVIKEIVA